MDTSYLDLKNELWQIVEEFIENNKVTCDESIWQNDFLGNELEEFACYCCDIVLNKDKEVL